MRYPFIFFDLDGTLTDPTEGITKSVQYALAKFGIESETEQLRS
jgi:phosphoglycolate phosphatase